MTSYPNSIDTDQDIPGVYENITEASGSIINSIREALFAIENTLGVNPQGAVENLATLLKRSLNDDGTLKSASLIESGLVSLPITNEQVGVSAGIDETKLRLDVNTQDLQNQISSNDIDIMYLQSVFTELLFRYNKHISGISERHSSGQVDHSLADGYNDGFGANVEKALDYLYGTLNRHRNASVVSEHLASAISYSPREVPDGETEVITSNNVQDAITEVETSFIEDRRKHNNEAHSPGVSDDGYRAVNGQAAVNDASLSVSRYRTTGSRDVIKVGLCNSATIKSSGFSPANLNATTKNLTIDVLIEGVLRTIEITGFQSISYPTAINRPSLDGVVNFLNSQFSNTSSQQHFPLTAFASSDGEIVIQHNIAKSNCKITIRQPSIESAVEALGFSNLVGVTVGKFNNIAFTVNGNRFTELRTIYDGSATHGSLTPTIVDLGVDVLSSGLNLVKGNLIHVYNHSINSANGTYQVRTVGAASSSTRVELQEPLLAGTFSFIIYDDTFVAPEYSGATCPSLDLWMDSDRKLVKRLRSLTNYAGTVSGLSVVSLSDDFYSAVPVKLQVTAVGSNRRLRLEVPNGTFGPSTLIAPGFIGYVKVFAPNSNSFVTIHVRAVSVTTGTATLTTSRISQDNTLILLGQTQLNPAINTFETPIRRRSLGLVGERSVSSDFKANVIERDVSNLNASGVIRGFDLIASSSHVSFAGGAAYIDGRHVSSAPISFAANFANGTYNFVLNKLGNVLAFKEGSGSYDTMSVSEILKKPDLILLRQVVIVSSAITSTIDGRFFINNVQDKLTFTVDTQEMGAGTFRSIDAAVLHTSNVQSDTKPRITVLSDVTTGTLSLDGNDVVCYGNLEISGNISLTNGSNLTVLKDLSVDSGADISLSGVSKLSVIGDVSFNSDVDVASGSIIQIDGDAAIDGTVTVGDNCKFIGAGKEGVITFSGNTDGVSMDGENASVINCNFVMNSASDGNHPIVRLTENSNSASLTGCHFAQSGSVDESNWTGSDLLRVGVLKSSSESVYGVNITNCVFYNLYSGIALTQCEGSSVDACKISHSKFGSRFYQCSRSRMLNSDYSYILTTSAECLEGGANSISGCNFHHDIDDSVPMSSTVNVTAEDSAIDSNTFSELRADVFVNIASSCSVRNNAFKDCMSDNYAILSSNSAVDHISVQGNSVTGHTGRVFKGNNALVDGNSFQVISTSSGKRDIINIQSDTTPTSLPSIRRTSLSNNVVYSSVSGLNETYIATTSSSIIGNQIVCGYIECTPAAREMMVFGNFMRLEQKGLVVTASLAGVVQLASNSIITTGNIALDLPDTAGTSTRETIVSGNFMRADGATCLRVGSSGVATNANWSIVGNTISRGSTYGIHIYAGKCHVSGNRLKGSSTHNIFVDSAAQNVYVSDNYLENGVVTIGANPVAVYVGENKNQSKKLVYSAFGSSFKGAEWELSTDHINSLSASTAYAALPLSLPPGAKIENVKLLCYTDSASAASIVVTLYTRSVSAALTSLGSVSTGISHGTGLITITPGTHYVKSEQEYFLRIASSKTGNKFYQAIVTVKY